jgi:hypothetical protein
MVIPLLPTPLSALPTAIDLQQLCGCRDAECGDIGAKVNHIAVDMSRRLRLVPLIILLAACSQSGGWKNPSLPPAQAAIDERVCRQSAEEDMDTGQQPYTSPGSEKYDTPMQMVDRSEQHEHFASLVSDCMERKGYRRTDQN